MDACVRSQVTSLPLAALLYAIFAFYLLACILKGNFKFGLRIFIFFPIHPMKIGNTMLNSFLFNVGLIIITAVATVQFCTSAFATVRDRLRVRGSLL
jgi:LMBR1 domain-containing protein 1